MSKESAFLPLHLVVKLSVFAGCLSKKRSCEISPRRPPIVTYPCRGNRSFFIGCEFYRCLVAEHDRHRNRGGRGSCGSR